MTMARTPLHHIVRVRTSDDLTYISPGLIDEIVINANQWENSIQSTPAALWKTTLPFSAWTRPLAPSSAGVVSQRQWCDEA